LAAESNICKQSEPQSFFECKTLEEYLQFTSPIYRPDQTLFGAGKLDVLDASKSGSIITVTAFLSNGVLSQANMIEKFNSCPGKFSFRATKYSDLDSSELSFVDSGKLFKIEGRLNNPSSDVCEENEFPCPAKLGRGSIITVNEQELPCASPNGTRVLVELTISLNIERVELGSTLFDLYLSNTIF